MSTSMEPGRHGGEPGESLWLDESATVTIGQLAACSGMGEGAVRELVDCGALAPLDAQSTPLLFSAACVVTIRRACRLRDELELDSDAVALALAFMDRITALERQVSRLRAQMPGQAG